MPLLINNENTLLGFIIVCYLYIIQCYSAECQQDTEVFLCPVVYVSKVVRCRSVQSSCLHYMPRGVSSTLDYMHVALSYYIGTGMLYHHVREITEPFRKIRRRINDLGRNVLHGYIQPSNLFSALTRCVMPWIKKICDNIQTSGVCIWKLFPVQKEKNFTP